MAKDPGEFNAACYREAAAENLEAAELLLVGRQFARSVYLYGVAVECILLAFLSRQGLKRDDHHDLVQLALRADLERFFRADQYVELTTNVLEVYKRWRNEHRYRSTKVLRKFCTRERLFRTPAGKHIKGDLVEAHAKVAAGAASAVIVRGLQKWEGLEQKGSSE